MLTGLAILERELGINDYARHRLRRRLAGRLPRPEAAELRRQLAELEERRAATLEMLDRLNEDYDERLEKAAGAQRARASRSPRLRREPPEQARRRLGIPDRR